MNVVCAKAFVVLIAFAGSVGAAESQSATQTGNAQLDACANAKHQAEQQCSSAKASTFGECSCEQLSQPAAGGDTWQCSVDVQCEEATPKAVEPKP